MSKKDWLVSALALERGDSLSIKKENITREDMVAALEAQGRTVYDKCHNVDGEFRVVSIHDTQFLISRIADNAR